MSDSNPSTSKPNPSTRGSLRPQSTRKADYASRDASKVYLPNSCERWRKLKSTKNLRTDVDVDDLLLDLYDQKRSLCVVFLIHLILKVFLLINYRLSIFQTPRNTDRPDNGAFVYTTIQPIQALLTFAKLVLNYRNRLIPQPAFVVYVIYKCVF